MGRRAALPTNDPQEEAATPHLTPLRVRDFLDLRSAGALIRALYNDRMVTRWKHTSSWNWIELSFQEGPPEMVELDWLLWTPDEVPAKR